MNARSQAVRNTLFSSVGIYTEYFLGMLVSIVIARHLGPQSFGTYSLIIWMVGIGVTATNSGSATAVTKFVAELRGAGQEEMVPALLKHLRHLQLIFLLIVAIIGACVLFFSGDRLAPGFNHLALFALLVMAVSLRAPYMFNVNVAKGFENFRATATIAAVATPLNLGMAIAAWVMDAPVEGFLCVYAISSAVFYLISRHQISRFVKPSTGQEKLPSELLRRVHRHIRIIALSVTVAFFMASEMEVLFLTIFNTVASAGQYKVGFQLAGGASLLVPGVFAAILLPMMANALSQGKEVAVRRFSASTIYLALLSVPLIAFGAVFAAPTILLLYGDAYASAIPVFAACMLAGGLGAIAQAASSLLISADHQHSMLLAYTICGIVKISLDVILISRYGLNGAVVACVIVSLTWFVTNMVLGLRVSGAKFPWNRLSRVATAGAVAGVMALPLTKLATPIAVLISGGLVLSVVYALMTFLLGCWSRGDIEYFKSLRKKLVGDRLHFVARFLEWASARAAPDFL